MANEKYKCKYVIELETITSQGTDIVDSNMEYIQRNGPFDMFKAKEYFKREYNTSRTNIHGVTFTAVVHDIYRRVL